MRVLLTLLGVAILIVSAALLYIVSLCMMSEDGV
jgi:hypothetical protein